MQTFLPYKDFDDSMQSLDNLRLGKQRVEALQIIKAIYIPDYGWKNHPAVKMWVDYPEALQMYHDSAINEWVRRGKNNNMPLTRVITDKLPHWLGDEIFHASHRSNLLRKDHVYYGKHNWKEPDNLPYYWNGYSKQDEVNYAY